jgi:hypothetical protein
MSHAAKIRLLAALVMVAAGPEAAYADSAHASAMPDGPANVSLEFDNQALTVLRIRLAPHEQTPMHDLTPRLVVWLSDADIRDTFADGHSNEMRRSAGAVDWVPAERHAGENLSDRPVEFLAVVPKTP